MDATAQSGSLTRIAQWAAHPFQSNMSALDWVLFLGLVICASAAWFTVIHHFKGTAE